LAATNFGAPRN